MPERSASFGSGSDPPLWGAKRFAGGKTLMPGEFTSPGRWNEMGHPKREAVWAAEQAAAKAAIEKLKG